MAVYTTLGLKETPETLALPSYLVCTFITGLILSSLESENIAGVLRKQPKQLRECPSLALTPFKLAGLRVKFCNKRPRPLITECSSHKALNKQLQAS